jgi:hypothetical protein
VKGIGEDFFSWKRHQFRAWLDWQVPKRFSPESWEYALGVRYDRQREDHKDAETGGYFGEDGLFDGRVQHLKFGARAFHVSGFGVDLGATRVSNRYVLAVTDLTLLDGSLTTVQRDDAAWMLDAAINYRLPQRRGFMSLGVKNLQNTRGFSYLELDHTSPRYTPERFVYGRLVLNFQ